MEHCIVGGLLNHSLQHLVSMPKRTRVRKSSLAFEPFSSSKTLTRMVATPGMCLFSRILGGSSNLITAHFGWALRQAKMSCSSRAVPSSNLVGTNSNLREECVGLTTSLAD